MFQRKPNASFAHSYQTIQLTKSAKARGVTSFVGYAPQKSLKTKIARSKLQQANQQIEEMCHHKIIEVGGSVQCASFRAKQKRGNISRGIDARDKSIGMYSGQ